MPDVEELWGDGNGTPAPSPEVMNKTKLFPVVYALETASVREERTLGEIYFKRVLEPDDVVRLRDAIDQLGAREESERLAERYLAEAVAALEVAGVSAEGRSEIEGYCRSLAGAPE